MFDDTSGWHAGVRRVRTLGSSMSTKSPTQLVAGIRAVKGVDSLPHEQHRKSDGAHHYCVRWIVAGPDAVDLR